MNTYSWIHLADHAVDAELPVRRARDRAEEAVTLSLLAEFDARKRYVPAGYSAMSAYCLGVLGYSEDAAQRLIQVARLARKFPALFPALGDGRLHKTGALLLATHLSAENVEEWIAAAAGKSKAQIERMLAERFPKVAEAASLDLEAAMATTEASAGADNMNSPAPERVNPAEMAAERPKLAPVLPRTRIVPLSAEWWALHGAMSNAMREKLARAEDLVGRMLPSSDPMAILEHALDLLLARAEQRKFSTTTKPRVPRGTTSDQTIPAAVRRAVAERDGHRCTFVSASDHRCEERSHLHYDHIVPKARGGKSTVDNLRLLCSAHNQYEAERIFGAGFMKEKREQARAVRTAPAPAAPPNADAHADIIPYLLALRYRSADAKRAAEACDLAPDAQLEERVKWGIRYLTRAWAARRTTPAPPSAAA